MEPAFLIIAVVVVVGISAFWQAARSRSILDNWAREGGYRLIHSERRWVRQGPFFFRSTKNQEVFYVTVQALDGRIRHGYVRCGGWFAGLFSDAAMVEWDD